MPVQGSPPHIQRVEGPHAPVNLVLLLVRPAGAANQRWREVIGGRMECIHRDANGACTVLDRTIPRSGGECLRRYLRVRGVLRPNRKRGHQRDDDDDHSRNSREHQLHVDRFQRGCLDDDDDRGRVNRGLRDNNGEQHGFN